MSIDKVFVRSPYNYDRRAAAKKVALVCLDDSLASQSSKDESDINVIVRRFGITGQMPQSLRLPTYGDFSQSLDYGSALRAIREADASFMQLPAEVRERFGNDPARFVGFCSDAKNLPELRKMGLANEEITEVKDVPTEGGKSSSGSGSVVQEPAPGKAARAAGKSRGGSKDPPWDE